jgi:hypothetical protein
MCSALSKNVAGIERSEFVICRKMDSTGDHHAKLNKPGSERQILHVFSHVYNLDLKRKSQK